MNNKKMICVGHSHARRFGSFTRGPFQGKNQTNLGLSRGDFQFAFHGEGGLRLDQLDRQGSASNLFMRLLSGARVCILFIGDNDVFRYEPQYLAQSILEKASSIKEDHRFQVVYVAPLLPRRVGAHGNVHRYNRRAAVVNNALRARAGNFGIQVMKQLFSLPSTSQREYDAQANLFMADGVHLNAFGNRRLYNYIRGIAIRAAR